MSAFEIIETSMSTTVGRLIGLLGMSSARLAQRGQCMPGRAGLHGATSSIGFPG